MSTEIERRFRALEDQLDAADRALTVPAEASADAPGGSGGGVPDMARLGAEVRELCGLLEAAKRADARAFLPRLETLLARVDAVDGAMRRRLDAISGELKQHGTRQTAVRAYGRGGPGGGSGGSGRGGGLGGAGR